MYQANARRRRAGFRKTETAEDDYKLLAVLPFLPLALTGARWGHTLIWQTLFVLATVWAIIVFGSQAFDYWRVIREVMRRDRR